MLISLFCLRLHILLQLQNNLLLKIYTFVQFLLSFPSSHSPIHPPFLILRYFPFFVPLCSLIPTHFERALSLFMGKNKKKAPKSLGPVETSGPDKNGSTTPPASENDPNPPKSAESAGNATSDQGVDDSETTDIQQISSTNGLIPSHTAPEPPTSGSDTETLHRQEIEALQKRIAELELQANHSDGDSNLRKQLEEVTRDRDDTKASYDSLLSKLSSMKTVFSKMKEAQNELEETKDALQLEAERADEAEKAKTRLESTVRSLEQKISDLNGECDRLTNSLTMLRREYQTKDDSFLDERYELENQNSRLSKTISELKAEITELKTARSEQALEMKDLHANNENLREKLDEKEKVVAQRLKEIGELEASITQIKYDSDITAKQLRNRVAELVGEVEQKNNDITKLTETVAHQTKTIDSFGAERDKLKQLENDVNAKQLLIGKLRHEAIILNEHLTKALQMLKQHLSSENNAIDKELVLNVLIGFLQFPRGDTKKYEALQLISALLDWDENQKVAAGLSHGTSQRVEGRQSFVSLWTDFLEKESRGK